MEPKNRIWNAASALQKRQTPLDRGIMKRTVGKPLSELCDDAGLSAQDIARQCDMSCSHCGYTICNCANVVTDTSGYARKPIGAATAWSPNALPASLYRLYTWQEAHELIERGYTMTQDVTLKNTNFVLWRKRDGRQEHMTPFLKEWEQNGRAAPAGMQQLIERRESNGFVITNRESF